MTKICIFAESEEEAKKWARSQNLDREQYFYAHSMNDILFKTNFHVIAIGASSIPSYFERLYNLALERGRINRL